MIPRWLWRTSIAAISAAGLAACGAAGGGGVTPAPSHSAEAVAQLTIGDAENGSTVAVRVGQPVMLVLHSTYWMIAGSSNPAVLVQTGANDVSPSPGCVPGSGCGTVTASFTARAPGHALINASRTSCGEALRCTGNQGSFTVVVAVSA